MATPTAEELRDAKRELHRSLFQPIVKEHVEAASTGRPARLAESARSRLNVVGIGIGEKVTRRSFTGEEGLKVYVQVKVPEKDLPADLVLPKSLDGIPVDVEECGQTWALSSCLANPRARQDRPFPAGVSVGGGNNPAGTLGYMVRKPGIQGTFILSNYHVLANVDPTRVLPVFQPGRGDGGLSQNDRIGQLDARIPIDFSGAENRVDAAVARVADGSVRAMLCAIGTIGGALDAERDDAVRMFGKQSGPSKGQIVDVDCDIVVKYRGRRQALFVDQLRILPARPSPVFARHGDSGSLVVVKRGPAKLACGLLFAAGGRNGTAFANPIRSVLNELGVELAI